MALLTSNREMALTGTQWSSRVLLDMWAEVVPERVLRFTTQLSGELGRRML